MLAALRLPAVLLGVGAGALAATILSLLAAVAFEVSGAPGGALAGLVPGIVAGFVVGGYVAGRMAFHSSRFHGSVAALGLTAVIVFAAQGGGGEASLPQVVLLAFIGIVAGGIGGTLGGRKRLTR